MGNSAPVASPAELAEHHQISEEEVATLLEAFKVDGNRKAKPLDMKQFKKTLQKVHAKVHDNQNFNPEVAEMVFGIFDVDKNGRVDVQEFIHGVSVFGALASYEDSGRTKEEKARLVFGAIDRDGSGKISKQEFRRYLSHVASIAKELCVTKAKKEGIPFGLRVGIQMALNLGEGKRSDEVTDEAFAADTDGDGEISLDEWLAAVNSKNEAINAFLDPGELVIKELEQMEQGVKEAGLTKENYEKIKREAFH